jgi:hypothetical protein
MGDQNGFPKWVSKMGVQNGCPKWVSKLTGNKHVHVNNSQLIFSFQKNMSPSEGAGGARKKTE